VRSKRDTVAYVSTPPEKLRYDPPVSALPSDSSADAAGELGRLARALSSQVRRARALGKRLPARERQEAAPAPRTPAKNASAPAPAPKRASAPPPEPARPPVTRAAAAPRTGAVSPARSAEDVRAQAASAPDLETLRASVAACEACGLCRTRTQTVFMDGEGKRGVLFVGEAPGADEDRTGVPFVGRAGQLLTDIITKGMGLARKDVWIANVLKCRPPDNREPAPDEKAICTPWLDRQIELMNPKVIIPLGRHAATHLLKVQATMGALRQRVHELGGRKIVPTFHPAYLLRSPGEKKECWKDIQLAMGVLGLPSKRTPER
jgi:uracil-DNA glycosylase